MGGIKNAHSASQWNRLHLFVEYVSALRWSWQYNPRFSTEDFLRLRVRYMLSSYLYIFWVVLLKTFYNLLEEFSLTVCRGTATEMIAPFWMLSESMDWLYLLYTCSLSLSSMINGVILSLLFVLQAYLGDCTLILINTNGVQSHFLREGMNNYTKGF